MNRAVEILQAQLALETKIATVLGYGFILNSPNGLFYRSGRVPKFARDWAVIGPLMVEHNVVPEVLGSYETPMSYKMAHAPLESEFVTAPEAFATRDEAFMYVAAKSVLDKLLDIKAWKEKEVQDALDAKRAKSAEQLQRQREAEAKKNTGTQT